MQDVENIEEFAALQCKHKSKGENRRLTNARRRREMLLDEREIEHLYSLESLLDE